MSDCSLPLWDDFMQNFHRSMHPEHIMATQLPVSTSLKASGEATAEKATELHEQLHALIDATQRAQGALKAGDHAMDFCLADNLDKKVSLAKSLIKGPVFLLISRGPWCPNVREQLLGLADIYPQILERSVSLIALAPSWKIPAEVDAETSYRLAHLPFATLTDEGFKIAGAYGLTFTPTAELRRQYQSLGYCDEPLGASDPLLVPATYFVNRSGEIIFAMIDSDPGNFLKPQALLRMLGNVSRRQDV